MKIREKKIKIKHLFDGYDDSGDKGIFAYGGRLDIRPAYQREFVYKDKQRDDVIRSVLKWFPLNVMYWVDKKNGYYEVLDGQQRSISICQYLKNDFSLDGGYFHSQPADVVKRILDYKLTVYVCDGEDSEKMDWFRIVNIAGERLTEQELRNSVYAGSWLNKAKSYFSQPGQNAAYLANGYFNEKVKRQELLQKAIGWVAGAKDDLTIREYMSRHQRDTELGEIRDHFDAVIDWVKATFPIKRPLMKDVDWGPIYAVHKDGEFNPDAIEEQISSLLQLEKIEIRKQTGIYEYVLDGDEQHLNLRLFDKKQKMTAYERQGRVCAKCRKEFEFKEMEGDHITPWKKGGLTVTDNLQMLCKKCNQHKAAK